MWGLWQTIIWIPFKKSVPWKVRFFFLGSFTFPENYVTWNLKIYTWERGFFWKSYSGFILRVREGYTGYLKSWKVAPVAHTLSCPLTKPPNTWEWLSSFFFGKTSPRTSRVAPTRWRTNSCLRIKLCQMTQNRRTKKKGTFVGALLRTPVLPDLLCWVNEGSTTINNIYIYIYNYYIYSLFTPGRPSKRNVFDRMIVRKR